MLKNELLESQCIQRIPASLLISDSEFEVKYYRSNYKFLPFRNFQPFRSEAICMISVIFWNKDDLTEIYNELINEFVKCNTFALEVENLRQSSHRLLRLSALNLFSRLLRSGDKNILFLMVRILYYLASIWLFWLLVANYFFRGNNLCWRVSKKCLMRIEILLFYIKIQLIWLRI